jgi:hypothetical protein
MAGKSSRLRGAVESALERSDRNKAALAKQGEEKEAEDVPVRLEPERA